MPLKITAKELIVIPTALSNHLADYYIRVVSGD